MSHLDPQRRIPITAIIRQRDGYKGPSLGSTTTRVRSHLNADLDYFVPVHNAGILPPSETARAAATTERERLACEAATPVFVRLKDAVSAARQALSMDDRRNLTKSNRVPWLEHVLSPDAPPAWGFAIIRSDFADESRWRRYLDAVDKAASHALVFKAHTGQTGAARAKFKMLYADHPSGEQEGPSPPALRQKFAELRSGIEWTPGLREDVFLYADAAVLESLDTERPFCWALEAEQSADDPKELEARGLKVALVQISPTFYARLLQKDLGDLQDDSRSRWAPYNGPPTLLNLHSQTRRAESGTWPPPHQWN
jgi:hypothetical protein